MDAIPDQIILSNYITHRLIRTLKDTKEMPIKVKNPLSLTQDGLQEDICIELTAAQRAQIYSCSEVQVDIIERMLRQRKKTKEINKIKPDERVGVKKMFTLNEVVL